MKYMLLFYSDEQTWEKASEAERRQAQEEVMPFVRELKSRGWFVAAGLRPTSTATSVRVREGNRLVTDGPFAETKEQLGGFCLIDAEDLDEAIGIAARHPVAHAGTVEIRPVSGSAGLPTN